jgi:hypothetical protein
MYIRSDVRYSEQVNAMVARPAALRPSALGSDNAAE